MAGEIKLILFDYDGVIVDSFPLLKKIYQRITDVLGIEMSEKDEHFRELIELDWRETYRKLDIMSKDKVNISEFIFHTYNSKHSKDVLPYKEIPHVLEELSKRYTLAVVTNNFRYEIEKRLRLHGLDKYFSAYYTCEDGKLKPHPDLINKCLKHFDVLPSEAAFVGDMDGDIQSAKAARIGKVIAVTYGYHLKHRLQEADIIIDTPGELLKIL